MYKELLFDTLGWKDRAWSKRLGYASIELLFQFLETQLLARRSCVVESNFKAEYATARYLDLKEHYGFRPVQIQCVTDGRILFERFRQRAQSGERHPGRCDHLCCEEFRARLLRGRLDPLAIGDSIIEIDTTDFDAIAYDSVFAGIARIIGRSKDPPYLLKKLGQKTFPIS